MLGAALVFVTVFRRLKLGATLGYIVAGALIGPQVLGLIQRSRSSCQRRRDRHRAAAVHRRAGASAEPAVAAAQGHLRARPGAGRAVRPRAERCCSTSRSAFRPKLRLRSACRWRCRRPRRCCRCCARTTSSTRRRASAPSRSCCSRTSSIVPMITIIAAMARVAPDPERAAGLDARALHRLRGRRAGRWSGGSSSTRCSGWSAGFGERELFVVAGLFTVIGAAAVMHALHLSVRARRLRRRRDARRIALPARARKRRRAVPLDPARPVLPLGRDAARPAADRRSGRCSSSGSRPR